MITGVAVAASRASTQAVSGARAAASSASAVNPAGRITAAPLQSTCTRVSLAGIAGADQKAEERREREASATGEARDAGAAVAVDNELDGVASADWAGPGAVCVTGAVAVGAGAADAAASFAARSATDSADSAASAAAGCTSGGAPGFATAARSTASSAFSR